MEKINTTKSVKKASSVLESKCKKTQEELKKLMGMSGCAGDRIIDVMLPIVPGSRDDVVFAGLNGVSYYFMRGQNVKMPESVKMILKNAGEL